MIRQSIRREYQKGKAREERFAYQALLAICFAVFLAVALVEFLLPWRWQAIAQRGGGSVIVEALDAARTTIPFAFMG
jgi:hypothetical protein